MQDSNFGPREYRMRTWQRALYIVLGVFLAGIGILAWYATSAESGKPGAVPIALALLPVCLGAYLLALAIRSRLIIDGSHIEVRGPFRERTAELSDVEGYRTISTRNGSFWRLQLKQGRGSIQIQKWFDCDDLRAWRQQLTDLDERDRNALLEEIKQAQDLGTTPDERLNALKQANHLNIALSAVAIAAAVVFFIYQSPLRLAAAVVLALVPAMVLYLMQKDPLLYALGKPKRDPRSDLSIAALASGIGLMLGGIAMHFVSYKPLLLWGALIAAVYVFAFSAYSREFHHSPLLPVDCISSLNLPGFSGRKSRCSGCGPGQFLPGIVQSNQAVPETGFQLVLKIDVGKCHLKVPGSFRKMKEFFVENGNNGIMAARPVFDSCYDQPGISLFILLLQLLRVKADHPAHPSEKHFPVVALKDCVGIEFLYVQTI